MAVDYRAIQWSYPPASNSDNNDLYSTGITLARIQSNNFADLAALQSYYWGNDQNSTSVYPHFVANADLHVTSPYLDGAGTPWTGVSDDIDGETRHATNPDIGADEFTPDASSVPLAGVYTIGSGSDYSTFSTAVQDLNLRGLSGPVTFNIADGAYNEQIKLFDIPGTSISDTVVFQSSSGNSADVTLQYSATNEDTNYVVRLYNADHFRFRNLTLSADTASGSPFGRVFAFYNSGDIRIQGNVLIGSPVAEEDDNHALIFGSLYNDLIIKENTFNNGDYGINVSGSSSSGTQVTNNIFNGYNGMSLSGQSNPIIANNTINKGGISTSGASIITDNILTNGGISGGASVITGNNLNHGGVGVSGAPVIEDNIINGGISVDCSGPPQIQKNQIQAGGRGIYITGQGMSSANRGLIANNMVNVSYSGNNTRGFEVNDFHGNIFLDLYNNTFNVSYLSNQPDNSRTGNSSSVLYLRHTGWGWSSNFNAINNIYTNLAGGYIYDIDYTWSPYNSPWDHNDLYTTGLTVAKKQGVDYADLLSWQTATNQDSNSVSVFPGYISNTDLHLTSSAVDSMGTPLAEITDDIDGDPRDATYPDIGADEFTATTVPPEALAGTYTVGDGGEFSSLSDAVNHMVYYGISAPVTINLATGFYHEQLQLFNISGTNDSTAITIQSLSGNPADVTLYYAATDNDVNYVVLLSDVDHVRFQNLTIMADTTEGASYGRVFQLEGELDDIQILNNVLIGSPGQGHDTKIIYSSSSLYSNNLIVNGNTFNDGDYGIYLTGSWNLSSLGTQVTNNFFNNNKGIGLIYHDAPIINDNTVEGSGAYNDGISVSNCDSTLQIQRNKINGGNIGISGCVGVVEGRGLIANNFVRNGYMSISGSSYLDIVYNSVNYDDNNNNYGALKLSGGDSLLIQNNIFAAIGGGLALYHFTSWDGIYSNNNDYFTSGINLVRFGWGNNDYYPNLDSLQAASGQDVNSISVYPAFNTWNDLHTASLWINNMAAPLSIVTEDIDGEPRDATAPDIGADEYTPAPGFSTPLTGNYTIGSGGDYLSFSQAGMALMQRGISASVTFDVLSGIYNDHFELFDIPGAGITDTITFQSQTGDPADVTLQYEATHYDSNYIVRLTGADRLQFKNLTFTADTTIGNNYGAIFVLSGIIKDILIQDNVLNGKSGTSSYQSLISRTNLTLDGLVVSGNIFNDGYYGVSCNGNNIQVINNIFNNSYYGISINSSQSLVISNNVLRNIKSYGITVSSSSNLQVTQNRISVHSETGFRKGLEISSSSGTAENRSLIANNFIHMGGAGRSHGIYLNNSTYQDVYYNSVNMTSLDSTSKAFYLYRNNGYNNVVDNIFANFSGGYACEVRGTAVVTLSDYNDFFTTGSVLARWQNIDYTDLAALQTGSSQDANSVSIEPDFVSETDLHLFTAELGGIGTPLTEVTDDIDGEPRDETNPDIGADEFTFTTAPVLYAIPDTSFYEDTQLSVPFSAWFDYVFDVDNDVTELTWSLFGGDSVLIDVVPVGVTFSVPENWFGVDTVNVDVSDGIASDTTALVIHVLSVNDEPVIAQPLPAVTIDEDDFGAIIIPRLEDYFDDIDIFDQLNYSGLALDSGLDSIVFGNLADNQTLAGLQWQPSGNIVTVKRYGMTNEPEKETGEFRQSQIKTNKQAKPAQIYLHQELNKSPSKKMLSSFLKIDITSQKEKGKLPFSTRFNLNLKNQKPVGKTTLAKGYNDNYIKITANIFNPDFVNEHSESSRNSLTDTTALIVFPTENFHGEIRIVITATDDSLASIADTLLLTVMPVNDTPVFMALADTSVMEDDTLQLVLSAFDADGDSVVFSAASDTSAVETIATDSLLTMIPVENWNGDAIVTVTAADTDSASSDTFMFTVIAVNDTPNISQPLADVTIDEDDFGAVIIPRLEDFFEDVDWNDQLHFTGLALGVGLDSIVVTGFNSVNTHFRPIIAGDQSIFTIKRWEVKALKRQIAQNRQVETGKKKAGELALRTSSEFNPTKLKLGKETKGNNQAPARKGIPQSRRSRSIHEIKGDDTPSVLKTYVKKFSNSATILQRNSRSDSTTLIVFPMENFNGDVEIIVEARDTSMAAVRDTLLLTIMPLNDVPIVVSTIEDIEIDEDTDSVLVADLDTVFYDVEAEALVQILSFSGVVEDTASVSLALDSLNQLFITPHPNWFGETWVFIEAHDSNDPPASVMDSFYVTVLPINDAPFPFSLLQPENEFYLTDSSDLAFVWESSTDIEDEDLTYAIYFSAAEYDTLLAIDSTQIRVNVVAAQMPRETTITWGVFVSDGTDTTYSSEEWTFSVSSLVGIDLLSQLPTEFALSPNYPNPFNPATTLRYDLPEQVHVTLIVYDLLGREVITLVNQVEEPGYKAVIWSGTNNYGQQVSAGVYLYRISSDKFTKVNKMILLR